MPTEPRKAHRRDRDPDTIVQVGQAQFGADPLVVIAGPCVIESETQLRIVAGAVDGAGGHILRGNTVTTVGTPAGFRPLGHDGVRLLADIGAEFGMPTVTQISEPRDAELVASLVDMVEISSTNMQNFELLRAVGAAGKPVLLKRGPSATFDEWLWSAEYVLAEGNPNVVLCERGIRAFEAVDILDLSAVPHIQTTSHLPVVVFPSHAVSTANAVGPLALAAQGAGAHGLVIEVHDRTSTASVNPAGQLTPAEFDLLMANLGINRLRVAIDRLDQHIIELLAERQQVASWIGQAKATHGMAVQIPEREQEILDTVADEARRRGLDERMVQELFTVIMANARKAQQPPN